MNTNRFARWCAGLIDPESPASGPPPKRLLPFFGWSLSGAWMPVLLATGLFSLGGLFEAGVMALLGLVVDATVAARGGFWTANTGLLAGSAILLLVLRPAAFGLGGAFQSISLMPNLFTQVMARLNRYTLGQSVGFFDNDFAGRIAQKQMQTANGIVSVVQETVNAISFAFASALGMLVLTGLVDTGLMLLLIVWLFAYFLLLRFFLPRIRKRSATRAAARARVTGQIVDTVTNIRTVKLFAHDAHEDRAALGSLARYRDRAVEWAALAVGFRSLLFVLAGALPVAMVGYGLVRWNLGAVTPGDLTAIGGMAIRLSQMTGWVSWTLMTIYADLGEVEDGLRTLSPDHALTDAPDAVPLANAGDVRFEGVRFEYGGEAGGLRGIDLTVAPGEKLGVVGASGAGKSTLVALLLRLYDPESGRVTIGGQDISKVTQHSLRRAIGMVTQETAMFNRAASDNIRYGRPDASDEDIIAAAERAEADTFIRDLVDLEGRQGYNAHLGERGVKLSGGQRQRIALARAILKDAPILVLDEATSALDSEVEAAILETLYGLMEGKTVIAIAHRLSTIAHMDRIVVLDAGRIVEEGSHSDLLATGGLYARFWDRQSGGFIGIDEAAE